MKTGRTVEDILCVVDSVLPAHVEWFIGRLKTTQLKNSQRIKIKEKSDTINASIIISKVEPEDSGTYFCKLNNTFGPGTELQVFSRCQFVDVFACFLRLYTCISLSVSSPGYADPQAVLSRSRVKDVFHFPQGYCWFCASPFLWFSFTDWWGPQHFHRLICALFHVKYPSPSSHCVSGEARRSRLWRAWGWSHIRGECWVHFLSFLLSLCCCYGWLSFSSELCSYCCMHFRKWKHAWSVVIDNAWIYTCDFIKQIATFLTSPNSGWIDWPSGVSRVSM